MTEVIECPEAFESRPAPKAVGGAYEGASRTSRELALHRPPIRSADGDILPAKGLADARARDLVRNDGYATGGVAIHKDSIVGSQFLLNARPNWRVLKQQDSRMDETWAEEFQAEVEAKFALAAESQNCWFDASRKNTLTGLVRLAVGVYVVTGEVLATAEWIRQAGRPFNTAIQMIHLDRLCNPDGRPDTTRLRGGIEHDFFGAPIAAHIRSGHPGDPFEMNPFRWRRVPFRKPWGRLQVLHIFEPTLPAQTRGIAEMVSVLKQMKMTSRFQDVTLQNAVVNATYAATLESELPREAALGAIGADNDSSIKWASDYLGAITTYAEHAKNLHIDGVKIPHLFPGTRLQLRPAGTVGGVGSEFEESLLRHIASGLGLSYEQFSRDYSKTNYSSARASMNETWKYMRARKKSVADRIATIIYELWFEELLNSNGFTAMPKNPPSFYEGINKEAYCACAWIGASRGQIDELKETQAAVLRINAGLSTLEDECASLGKDWRVVLEQIAREKKMKEALGVQIDAAGLLAKTPAHSPDNSDERPNSEERSNA